MVIIVLHWVSGDTITYYQQPDQHSASYTQYQDKPIEEKSSLEKSFEVFLSPHDNSKSQRIQYSQKIPKSKIFTPFAKSYHNKKNLLT